MSKVTKKGPSPTQTDPSTCTACESLLVGKHGFRCTKKGCPLQGYTTERGERLALRAFLDRTKAAMLTREQAVRALYYAARWSADRPVNEAKLWTAVRDAFGFQPGEAPRPNPSRALPPLAIRKMMRRKSTTDRNWRPQKYQKMTQKHDILTVHLGFGWRWEILVRVKWQDTPVFGWPNRRVEFHTAESAMKDAERAAKRIRETTSEEEFKKMEGNI